MAVFFEVMDDFECRELGLGRADAQIVERTNIIPNVTPGVGRGSGCRNRYARLVSTTRVTRHIRAPRSRVYRALLDPAAVRQWMVPDQMTSRIHSFEPRTGGTFRISLTYDRPTSAGKTTAQTDTFHGRFVELVPDSKVVQAVEFDSDDPSMASEMTITHTLLDADGGTDLVGVHENLPPGVPPADNELGWRMSIDKLAALVELEP